MYRWLRDTLNNSSPTDSFGHSIIRRRLSLVKDKQMFSRSSTEDDETHDQTFFHHPHRQINYIDLPQQEFITEYTYSTCYNDKKFSSTNTTTKSIDEQIYEKLVVLQHRQDEIHPIDDRQENNDDDDDEDENIPIVFYRNPDENLDFASVAFWYRNVMKSMKKFM